LELGDYERGDLSIFYDAVEAFEASIDVDPEWAPSHAALGRVHHFYYRLNPERQLRLSREQLEEALRLDPEYGPAVASLGYVNMLEGDFDASLEAYEHAEVLGAENNWGRALLFSTLGRFDDALEQYRTALALAPLSVPIKMQLAETLYCTERYEELRAVAAELLRSGADRVQAMTLMAHALARTGRHEEAVRIADEVASLRGQDLVVADTLALAGLGSRARAAINSVKAGDSWWTLAPAAITLGEADVALDILEQAERDESSLDGWIRCAPEFRSLAGNPRFDALMERLDLPE
jgi:tetratricopeptide (TPR) repeat protein